jgi:hypothetical protein
MRTVTIAVLLLTLGLPARASRLDLELYSESLLPGSTQEFFYVSQDLWQLGSPLNTRGESRTVRAVAHGGMTALATIGTVAGIAGTGLCGPACAVGFGIVALVNGAAFWSVFRRR